MANKPLKSIKFPGLFDTYTVPEVDATLTGTGKAADAKKTGDEVSAIKADLSQTAVTAEQAYLNIYAAKSYTINSVDTYKNAYIAFPFEVGKTYTIKNASASAYVSIASTNNDVTTTPLQDVELLINGLNANRSTTVTPTLSAKYLRVYCTATPATIEVTTADSVKSEIDGISNTINKELTVSGNLEVTHIQGKTMNTSGVIYDSSGNSIAYAKVYKGTFVTFYADNEGTMEAANCRYGFMTKVPTNGTVSGYGQGYTATAPSECYIVFTRPGKTLYSATYVNELSALSRLDQLEDDVYSASGTLETEKHTDTAINNSTGYWFTSSGWTAGSALVKGGSQLTFLADGVVTNCRYTICHDTLDYANIVTHGTNYGVLIPNDRDYWIIIAAPSDVTAFTLSYTLEGIKEKVNGYWYGKKIVWFGTSIPAGVINAGSSGGIGSYPERIGNMLGARVYNEAVGSSRARGGSHTVATNDDPLGWAGMSPLGILLSLSISSTEKQGFIDDWSTKWSNIVADPSGTMSNLTPAQITLYKNSSWDIKLNKYLTGGSVGQCDLYVFDHGFNDAVSPGQFDDMSDNPPGDDPTNRSYFLGAMAFLFKKILDDNPKAKIIIIGHYMNAPTQGTSGQYLIKNGVDKCCEAQEKLATLWGIPIVKTWEYMRISNNIITKDNEDIPVLFAYFPDGIHPASDNTGYALQYYADVLEPHIRNIH